MIDIKEFADAPFHFKGPCKACGHSHIMMLLPCPECQGRGGDIPMPASTRVRDRCFSSAYRCDGCEAYAEHTAV